MKFAIYFALIVGFCSQNVSSYILWPCDNTDDCSSEVPTSFCSPQKYCECPAGFTFSADVKRCLKEARNGFLCSEQSQCSYMLTGAECRDGVCGCFSGYTYVKGRCRTLVDLGERCTIDLDCNFSGNRESVVCSDGTCQCADGFYRRSENVCRRPAMDFEDCIVNEDCIEPETKCFQNQTVSMCIPPETKDAAVQTQLSFDDNVNKNNLNSSNAKAKRLKDIRYIKLNSTTSNDTKFSSVDSAALEEEDSKFGDSCDSEHFPCTTLKFSVCRRGFCQCEDGYYESNGKCKAELGEIVNSPEDCGDQAIWRNNKCGCKNSEFFDVGMQFCLKNAQGVETSCTQQSQCSPYGAYCPEERPKRCRCFDHTSYNEQTQFCEPKKGLGEYCVTSESCTVSNTDCSNVNTCVCKANYLEQNGLCKPGLQAKCNEQDMCAPENSECIFESVEFQGEEEDNEEENEVFGACECKEDFVPNTNRNGCLEEATNYNETCIDSEQCRPLLGDKGSCVDGQCGCAEELHLKNGKCNDKKELAENCIKSSECFLPEDSDRVECRNGVCQCQFEYSTDVEKQECIRPKQGKSASNKPSPLKVVTLVLIACAVLITGSALKDAYYP